MNEQPTLEEFTKAIDELPHEFKAQLADVIQPQESIDTVAIKLELVKFVTELQKHNQAIDWETNKVKPKKVSVQNLIDDAQKLFNFVTE